jgi:hypothetical protein
MAITFPYKADGTAAELRSDMHHLLFPQLERKVLPSQSIGTAVTSIAHGLKGAPRTVNVTPYSDCRWWMPSPPDDRFIYLQASAAVSATLELVT